MADSNVSWEIEEEIGVLSRARNGWTTELNLVSWNDKPAKYDLRKWAPDHERCGRGITLTEDELDKLSEIIDGMD